MRKPKLTTWIVIAMILGIAVGYYCNQTYAPDDAKVIAGYISLISDVFLRLIRMIIAPLVFATLVSGIGHMHDISAVGRIGMKSLGWFIGASLVSLALGMILVNLMQPGAHLNLPTPEAAAATNVSTSGLNFRDFVTHLVPRSIAESMANNEILQIVVFSLFFGIACASIGKGSALVVSALDELAHIVLKMTGYVMMVAPFAVFASMAAIVTTQGLGIILTYGVFVAEFYIGLVVLWALLVVVGFVAIGRPIFHLMSLVREPFLLAFSTASSEAAYPKMLDQLEKFPLPPRIVSFVLPLGYSFNLDGSMMYCSFATLFITQAYNMHMPIGTQIVMLLTLMLTSKGIAGVPRASLVVVAATLSQFNIPEAGLLLVIGIDQFLDMGRSATNVIGNALATAVVAKWEGAPMPDRSSFGGAGPEPLPVQ